MLELYQAEWCPSSRRVRQRLTELGIDYVNRQVPARRHARIALRAAVGADTIPALRLENGAAIVGADNILVYLGEYIVESPRQKRIGKGRRSRSAATSTTSATARVRVEANPAARDFKNVATPTFQGEGRQGGEGSGT